VAYDYVLTAIDVIENKKIGHYPVVIIKLYIHRKPRYYVVNLIVPCFLLSLVAIVTYILLPSNSERLDIGMRAF